MPLSLLKALRAATSLPLLRDDGTYLARIDPLGGQWQVGRMGDADFTGFKAWIGFSDGGFLNHGAGCGGGFPAFYRLDGDRIAITRLEAIRTGKCAGTPELANGTPALRAAAAASERRLAAGDERRGGFNSSICCERADPRSAGRAGDCFPSEVQDCAVDRGN